MHAGGRSPGFAATLGLIVGRLIAGLALLAFVGGCANYQLGTGGKLTFATLYLEPVANHTTLPQAQALVSSQLRERFLRDGRVTLVNSSADADATLKVIIVSYNHEVATVREGDTGLAQKFRLTLGANCTLRDRAGKNLFEARPVSTHRDAFTQGGQLQSEYQTLPLLAESLADKIAHAALDVW